MTHNKAFETICRSVLARWPVDRWASLHIVVAVSGGADSVCLLRTLLHLNPEGRQRMIVAHYDHQMRADSDKDTQFVLRLCQEFGLVCETGISDKRDLARSEASLRDERYAFLESVACRAGARYVVVAHNRNDQVETILHNVLRGTGGSGASGMSPFRPLGRDLVLARPLLDVPRSMIEEALLQMRQTNRTDPSNVQSTWTRNWLRNELLPILRSQFSQADEALLRHAENIGQLQTAVDHQANQLETQVVTYQDEAVKIDVENLQGVPEAILVSLLQHVWKTTDWPRGEMTQEHWKRVVRLVDNRHRSVCSRFQLPGNIFVTPARCSLTLSRNLSSVAVS